MDVMIVEIINGDESLMIAVAVLNLIIMVAGMIAPEEETAVLNTVKIG